jgi:hypothetical protein
MFASCVVTENMQLATLAMFCKSAQSQSYGAKLEPADLAIIPVLEEFHKLHWWGNIGVK